MVLISRTVKKGGLRQMMRSNLKELLAVLEEIRANEYPEIPAETIEQIVTAQYENQDNRVLARSKTMKIVSDFVNKESEREV